MREILFRGRRLDNGEWVIGGSIIHFLDDGQTLCFMPAFNEKCVCTHDAADNITAFDTGMFYKIDPNTVGQFTGLYDKNGKRIFEGDIVETTTSYYNDIRKHRETVTWDNRIENDSFGEPYTCGYCIYGYDWAIIGSIHDNPEPLEDKL